MKKETLQVIPQKFKGSEDVTMNSYTPANQTTQKNWEESKKQKIFQD